ncbi:putative PAS/PAC sensor protein [Actinoplanes sp. SE50]|uniref:PAS domain S-box protein n=1 Tax=unclassified Actinoplanes TaxID=2626549 RepID=UPI00023EC4DD|nr:MULTISPECIES: PAS domain S-box protein [unclassified Actinoplanes]AEV86407.1 putative PAS/PAC sensor protein [Actinoplanes sp. SE50/110]ATO84804.1 putative PAS/PAC sensor protein [Actinoplanes sp. SE50]SLM02214.1 signal transduction histidine kinase [Actinoplanes sp. SE50/110]
MLTPQITEQPVADGRNRAVGACSLAYLHIDRAGRIQDWNEAAERLFGWPRDEVIGRPLADTIIPPALRSAHNAGFARRLALGDGPDLGHRFEAPAVHRDGSELTVSMTLDSLGPDGFCAFISDQTEWHQARQELQRSNQLINAILQHTTAVISAKDLDGRYLFVNGEYERVFQVSAADMVGREEADVLPAAIAAGSRAHDVEVAGSGAARTVLEQLPFGDDIREYVVTRVPLADPDGSVYGVCTIAIDDTARRRTEAALAAGEERFRSTVNNAPGMLYQFRIEPDGTGAFTFVSAACRDLYGLAPEQIVGGTEADLITYIAEEHRESYRASVRESAATLEPWEWRGAIVRHDGQRRWLYGVARPHREPGGATVWDGMLLDQTREHATEVRLAGTRHELEDLTHRLAPLSFTAAADAGAPVADLVALIDPADHDELARCWAAARDGRPADAECAAAGPGGGRLWVRLRPRPDGQVDGACFRVGRS